MRDIYKVEDRRKEVNMKLYTFRVSRTNGYLSQVLKTVHSLRVAWGIQLKREI